MENSKAYIVQDSNRTNPLSYQPGGGTVTVYYQGYHAIYNNIKRPNAYIKTILNTNTEVLKIEYNGMTVYTKNLK